MNASTDKLTQDVKVLAADLQELLKASASHTGETIHGARARVENALSEARDSVAVQARQVAGTADRYMQDNPWKTAGISALVGALIGYLIGQR